MSNLETTQKPASALVGLSDEYGIIRWALESGTHTLAIGETGTGKTSMIQAVAAELGREVVRVNLNGNITADQLVGRFQADGSRTFFEHGVLVGALRRGAVLLLDEINAATPDVLFTLFGLLESGGSLYIPETCERIMPAPGFVVAATCNPSGDYAGTRALNHALMSRFGVAVAFPRLSGSSLAQALGAHVPECPADHVMAVADVLSKIMDAQTAGLIQSRIGIREGIAALRIITSGGKSVAVALQYAVAHKLESWELDKLKEGGITFKPAVKRVEGTLDEMLTASNNLAESKKEVARLTRRLKKLEKVKELLTTVQEAGAVAEAEELAESASA